MEGEREEEREREEGVPVTVQPLQSGLEAVYHLQQTILKVMQLVRTGCTDLRERERERATFLRCTESILSRSVLTL